MRRDFSAVTTFVHGGIQIKLSELAFKVTSEALYLEAFNDTRDGLVLQGRVLALGLLTNHHHVKVLVP